MEKSKKVKKSEKKERKKLLKPRNDYVFKRIFGDVRNKDILASFLRCALCLGEDDLAELEITDPYTKSEKENDKTGILDIRCKTKLGKYIGIEIQVANDPAMRKRVIFSNSKHFSAQLLKGEE
jgi:predicted transposase/invertase (TIGR01784 family)